MMLSYLVAYLVSGAVFIGLDATWLSLMGPRLYKPLLQNLLATTIRPAPAVLFYVLYIAGILIFAVAPASSAPRVHGAMLRGACFGLIAYGTYDLTNQATLRTWPAIITIADLGWGMFVTAVAAGAGCLAWQWLAKP